MSYYGEKKADDILVEIVASELAEFSGGQAVSSPKMAGFIARRLFKSLVIPAVAALFGLLIPKLMFVAAVFSVIEIISLVKFFSGDKMVSLIAAEAKKAPDKKISTIISEICVRNGTGTAFVLRESKKTRKPVIITVCAIFAALIAGGAAYLFMPITLYTETEGGYAVSLCRTGLTGNVTVESYKDGKPVVGINSGAFKNNFYLKNVELPDTLTYIEGEAFMNCIALQSIVIPPKVTEIRGDTFHNCKVLKNVQLHDNITALHAQCFMGCESLREITLPHGITEIRESTFNGCCSLMTIDIPEGVTRIAARAFFDCDSLYEVTVPRTVTEIGSSAFRNCGRLTQIVLPSGCSVNERAFKESPTEILYY